jgi:hypothetical protein
MSLEQRLDGVASIAARAFGGPSAGLHCAHIYGQCEQVDSVESGQRGLVVRVSSRLFWSYACVSSLIG